MCADRYRRIVKYKTAFYSFYLPVALALLMAGYDGNEKVFDTAASILLPMGEYFQIQVRTGACVKLCGMSCEEPL